jgi:hypothetical protein
MELSFAVLASVVPVLLANLVKYGVELCKLSSVYESRNFVRNAFMWSSVITGLSLRWYLNPPLQYISDLSYGDFILSMTTFNFAVIFAAKYINDLLDAWVGDDPSARVTAKEADGVQVTTDNNNRGTKELDGISYATKITDGTTTTLLLLLTLALTGGFARLA